MPRSTCVALWQVARANRRNLNVEGASATCSPTSTRSPAPRVAGLVVWTTGFERADPIASLAVAASMLATAWPLSPSQRPRAARGGARGPRPDEVDAAIRAHAGVTDVHDLHVWEISSGFPSLSAHVLVGRGEDCHGIRRELETMLHDRFALEHTTLQVEHTSDRLLEIQPLRDDHPDG